MGRGCVQSAGLAGPRRAEGQGGAGAQGAPGPQQVGAKPWKWWEGADANRSGGLPAPLTCAMHGGLTVG